MKKHNAATAILIFVVLGVAFGYARANAQQGTIKYIEERLRQQNIPLIEIKHLRQFPIQIEITIQSASEGKRAMPEDAANLHWVTREVLLANKKGFQVDSYVRILVNTHGEPIYWSKTNIRGEMASLPELSPASLTDDVVERMTVEEINTHGLAVKELNITSFEGIQTMTLQLSTASLDEANRAIPQVIASLRPFMKAVNDQGSQIAVCQVLLADEDGNILLNYLLDMQLSSEIWRLADGLDMDWFPHPPSEP